MRERWLLQGMGVEEEEVRRKQLEQDEEQGKRLEDMIHRYCTYTNANRALFCLYVPFGIAAYIRFFWGGGLFVYVCMCKCVDLTQFQYQYDQIEILNRCV